MMHNAATIASLLKKNVDWDQVMNLIASLDNVFNERSDRFIKGKLIEIIVCQASNNMIEHVGCDDFDTYISSLDVRIEQKHISNGIWTDKKKTFRKNITAKLINSQGSTTDENLLSKIRDKYFDYLLITSDYGAILYDKEYVLENCSISASLSSLDGDGVIFKGNPFDGYLIYGPVKGVSSLKREAVKNKKDELDRQFVNFLVEAEKQTRHRHATVV